MKSFRQVLYCGGLIFISCTRYCFPTFESGRNREFIRKKKELFDGLLNQHCSLLILTLSVIPKAATSDHEDHVSCTICDVIALNQSEMFLY